MIPVKDNLALTSALVAQLRHHSGHNANFVFDNRSVDQALCDPSELVLLD
jgi:hypothetical protein